MTENQNESKKPTTWLEVIAQRQGITADELRHRNKQKDRERNNSERGCVIRALESALGKLTGRCIKATNDEWDKRIEDANKVLRLSEDIGNIEQMLIGFSKNDTPLGQALKGVSWQKTTMTANIIHSKASQDNIAILPLLSITSLQGREYHLCHIGVDENDTLVSLSDTDAPFSIAGGEGVVFQFTKKE